MVFHAVLCDKYEEINEVSCAVEYLKSKGKLNETFQSAVPQSSQCQRLTPKVLSHIKATLKRQLEPEFPDAIDCIIDEFDKKDGVDYILKDAVVQWRKKFVNDTQVEEEAEKQLNDVMNEITLQCPVDERKFNDLWLETLRRGRGKGRDTKSTK